jgi:UPF0755 protein
VSKQRSSRYLRLAWAVALRLIAAALFASMLTATIWWGVERYAITPLPLADRERFTIAPGSHLGRVANQLAERGLLEWPKLFRLLAQLDGVGDHIHAGDYLLIPGTTPRQLLSMVVEGAVIDYATTLVEGWRFSQWLGSLTSDERIDNDLAGLGSSEIMQRLGRPELHPEGRFFPDTYHFRRGETASTLLQRAMVRMEAILIEEWSGRADSLPLKTADEALVLASIIEKESGQQAERAAIAGVFIRRLIKGMRLQTDPTVIYGIGDSFDGNLRRSDLRRDTPYNTYTRKGLPPTPIAMPGRAAIHAALHPADGDTLYFVARGDGSHHFSKSLKEHNRAVRRYQLRR